MSEFIGRTLLNRYRVDAFVGRGGMAEVYKVWDTQRATTLALKLLRDEISQDRVFLRRFQREARTLETLQHPNIIRFYGLEQDGLLTFMLMDFVQGSSLRTEIFQLNGVAMGVTRLREVMRAVCSALHFAHNQGFVHSDMKPGNVLVRENGDILVGDFGIARMVDTATATMVGIGTPAYMAPEQIRGENPSPQTDIYALGVVLYEMLTGGERPFTGERAEATGTTSEKVMWEHLNVDPPSPRKHNPNLSPALDALVMRCLEKSPQKRFASALELLNALEAALGSQPAPVPEMEDVTEVASKPVPVMTPPPSVASEPEPAPAKPRRSRRGWVWAFAALALIAVAAAGVMFGPRLLAGTEPTIDTNLAVQATILAQNQLTSTAEAGQVQPPLITLAPLSDTEVPGGLTATQEAISTAAAQTMEAQITQNAGITPTDAGSDQAAFADWLADAKILLFEDMAGYFGGGRVINLALNDMGLSYTDVEDALGHYKDELLSGKDWDLIISASEVRGGVSGEFFVYLDDAIGAGSAVIIETWYLDYLGSGAFKGILNRCDLEVQGNYSGSLQPSQVVSNDPLFQQPNVISGMGEYTGFWGSADLGDLLRLGPGSTSRILLTTQAGSTSNYGVLTSCLDGRVLIQTFGTHSYPEFNMRQLWQNYIYNALLARYLAGG